MATHLFEPWPGTSSQNGESSLAVLGAVARTYNLEAETGGLLQKLRSAWST